MSQKVSSPCLYSTPNRQPSSSACRQDGEDGAFKKKALRKEAPFGYLLRIRRQTSQAGAGFSPLAKPGIGRGSGRKVSCGSLAGTGGAAGGGGGIFSGNGFPSIRSFNSLASRTSRSRRAC